MLLKTNGMLLPNYLIIQGIKKIQTKWTYVDVFICHYWSNVICIHPIWDLELPN